MAPTRQSTTRRPRNFDYPVPLNGGMTKNYLAQVEEDARRLRLSLRDDDTLPAWVNAYVFTSADRLQTASRYMDRRIAAFQPSEYSGWGDDARKAMQDNPDYFVWWYTAKSLGLVAVAVVAAYCAGRSSRA